MRLLFLALVVDEHHEVAIGIDLANQLREHGFDCHFLLAPYNTGQAARAGHPFTVVMPEHGVDLPDVVRTLVRGLRPDALVLSDYIGHWLTCTYTYDTDPWFVDDLGLPVLPIDLYELAAGGLGLEIRGRATEVSDRILSMPARLRPVPVARPAGAQVAPHSFPYRCTRVRRRDQATRARVREELGLGPDDRLLVIPGLRPQHAMLTRGDETTRRLAARVPELVVEYLRELPASTHFLMMGPTFDAYRALPPERTHLRPEHTAGEHDDAVSAADAVWSSYFPAASLETAVLADVPGLLTTNGLDVPAGDPGALARVLGPVSGTVETWLRGFPDGVPSFSLWPWRWNGVMRPLMRDNPFLAAGRTAELLDHSRVVRCLHDMLYEPAARAELAAARAEYHTALREIPPTQDVVLAAARRAGVNA